MQLDRKAIKAKAQNTEPKKLETKFRGTENVEVEMFWMTLSCVHPRHPVRFDVSLQAFDAEDL